MSPRVGKLLIAGAGFGLGLLGSRMLPATLAQGSPAAKPAAGLIWKPQGKNLVLEVKSRDKAYLVLGEPVDAKKKGGLHGRSGSASFALSEQGGKMLVFAVDFRAAINCGVMTCHDCSPADDCPPVPQPDPWPIAGATLLTPPCGGDVPCPLGLPWP